MSTDTNEKLTLPEAQEGFLNIVRKLNDLDNTKELISWIQWNWLNGNLLWSYFNTESTSFWLRALLWKYQPFVLRTTL
jgi:hypothetical protein